MAPPLWQKSEEEQKSPLMKVKEESAKAGTKIARRNINNLRYADGTTLMAESEEELKSLNESKRGE